MRIKKICPETFYDIVIASCAEGLALLVPSCYSVDKEKIDLEPVRSIISNNLIIVFRQLWAFVNCIRNCTVLFCMQ